MAGAPCLNQSGRSQRYMPGLDGLRAIAVLAVIAYHLGFGWAAGGLLGVGVFFTLSGYLITDLLLAQRPRGGIRLGGFWLGRARRLLPALFLMLVVVIAWVTVIGPHQPPSFSGGRRRRTALRQQLVADLPARLLLRALRTALARSTTSGRWRSRSSSTSSGRSCCCSASASSPRCPLLRGAPPAGRRDPAPGRRLGDRDGDPLPPQPRPLAGLLRDRHAGLRAAGRRGPGDGLAQPPADAADPGAAPGACSTASASSGLLVIALMIWRTNEYSPFLYRGGFALLSVATALVIAALAHPACRLGLAARLAPAALDRRALLRHLPLALPDHRPDDAGRRPRRRPAARRPPGRGDHRRRGALLAVHRGADSPRRPRPALAQLRAGRCGASASRARGWVAVAALLGRPRPRLRRAGGGRRGPRVGPSSAAIAQDRPAEDGRGPAQAAPSRTNVCRAVIHIGDSTSEGLISPEYLPNPTSGSAPSTRGSAPATQHFEISGARSIFETYEGSRTARKWPKPGKTKAIDGCWVLALGTNDAADVVRRLERRARDTDRSDDVDDRRRTGDVGQRQVAAHERALRGGQHAALGRSPAQGVPQLPEHARLRLGRGR